MVTLPENLHPSIKTLITHDIGQKKSKGEAIDQEWIDRQLAGYQQLGDNVLGYMVRELERSQDPHRFDGRGI